MNGLHYSTVKSVRLVDARTVEFTIELATHQHLRNPQVVQEAMDDYLVRYAAVESWQATAAGGLLIITVYGTVTTSVDINL